MTVSSSNSTQDLVQLQLSVAEAGSVRVAIVPIELKPIAVKDQFFYMTKAVPQHAEKLYTLVNSAYAKEATRRTKVNRFDTVEDVAKLIQKTETVTWFILQPENSQEVIGSLQVAKTESGKYCLGAFAINPTYKDLQLGTKMLDETEKYMSVRKIDELFLEVLSVAKEPFISSDKWLTTATEIESEPNKLAAFYERNGFSYTGTSELPALDWQKATRLDEYHGRVFFKEMRKNLRAGL